MQNALNEMLKLLSDEDKVIFERLSQKMKMTGGNIALLSEEERSLIAQMESKYGEKINKTHQEHQTTESVVDILEMPFALYVRQILARDLGEQIPEEELAVKFVFENKWLPIDCQDERLIESLFERFESDIYEVNQWRKDLVGIESDKKMAVGLAWFMVIYQMNQRFNVE
jgi:hypothetical protein